MTASFLAYLIFYVNSCYSDFLKSFYFRLARRLLRVFLPVWHAVCLPVDVSRCYVRIYEKAPGRIFFYPKPRPASSPPLHPATPKRQG